MIEQASGHLTPVGAPEEVEFVMQLDRVSVEEQVGMSPSARHIRPEDLKKRIELLPEVMSVTARASVTRLKKNHR